MQQTREKMPLVELETIRDLAPLLGYRALTDWYESIDNDGVVNTRFKKIEASDGEVFDVSIIGRGTWSRFASVAVAPEADPSDVVRVTARRRVTSYSKGTYNEIDLVTGSALAWRSNSPLSIDLIPRGVSYSTTFEPKIVNVSSGEPIDPTEAERRLLKTFDLMTLPETAK